MRRMLITILYPLCSLGQLAIRLMEYKYGAWKLMMGGTQRVRVPFCWPDYMIRSSKIISMSCPGRPMSYDVAVANRPGESCERKSPGRVVWKKWNRSKPGMRIGLPVILMATYLDYWMYEAARSPIRVRRSHERTRKRHLHIYIYAQLEITAK